MEKAKAGAEAGEGSHPEAHQTLTEGSSPSITSGQSNAEPKTTVDDPFSSVTDTLAHPGSTSKVSTTSAPKGSTPGVIASPGSASKVPTASAPMRSAAENMASPGSASKVSTTGAPKGSTPGVIASPGSASKVQKSVKHLECAYFFGSSPGCKWTEEQCLYSHTPTGSRAAPPVQIEPGSKSAHLWFSHPALVNPWN